MDHIEQSISAQSVISRCGGLFEADSDRDEIGTVPHHIGSSLSPSPSFIDRVFDDAVYFAIDRHLGAELISTFISSTFSWSESTEPAPKYLQHQQFRVRALGQNDRGRSTSGFIKNHRNRRRDDHQHSATFIWSHHRHMNP